MGINLNTELLNPVNIYKHRISENVTSVKYSSKTLLFQRLHHRVCKNVASSGPHKPFADENCTLIA